MRNIIGLGLLLSWYALAGDSAGTGGDVVRCEKNGQVSYELLDFYEANGITLSLGNDSWDAVTKALHAVERLKDLDADRFQRYETAVRTFYDKVQKPWIQDGPPLEDITDAGEVKLPTHCKLLQAAIKRKEFHPSIPPYLIDKRVWDKLTENSRAGLILHEIIWSETAKLGHANSERARKFNALLASEKFEEMSKGEYDRAVKELFKVVYKPEFSSQQFDINAMAGQNFELRLRNLLLNPVDSNLQWDTLGNLPKWLEIKDEMLAGFAPAEEKGKTLEFDLVVRDKQNGAIAHLRIKVK